MIHTHPDHTHAVLIPDEAPEVSLAGMVEIRAQDGDTALSLMLYTRHARVLRDALNEMDLKD
jgi:hypothetical protein